MKLLYLFVVIAVFAVPSSVAVQSSEQKSVKSAKEYALLQAAYLFNIAKFIDWPEDLQHPSFKVCLYGESADQLENHFTAAFQKRLLGQRVVETKLAANRQDLSNCHVIYLTSNEVAELSAINDLSDILIVSSPEVTIVSSALFALRLESDRISIYYNKSAQEHFRLPISTALLRITTPVQGAHP